MRVLSESLLIEFDNDYHRNEDLQEWTFRDMGHEPAARSSGSHDTVEQPALRGGADQTPLGCEATRAGSDERDRADMHATGLR